jgi:hypothetical protein
MTFTERLEALAEIAREAKGMTPTQAQIEAAAKELHDLYCNRFNEFSGNDCPDCAHAAKAALAAAAQAGDEAAYMAGFEDCQQGRTDRYSALKDKT